MEEEKAVQEEKPTWEEWRDDFTRRQERQIAIGLMRRRLDRKINGYQWVVIERVEFVELTPGEPVPGGQLKREDLEAL